MIKGRQISLKSSKARLKYGKANMLNKLNHKQQPQARMCEENIKNNCLLKYYMVKGSNLEGCRRTVMQPIKPIFSTRTFHNIKVVVLY